MCDFCHIGKTDRGGLFLHEPVAEGRCTECHDPHGSRVRTMLRAPGGGALCLTCHETVTKGSHPHTPLAEKNCIACHRPHSSIHPHLLVETGRDLCLRCHEPFLPAVSAGHKPAFVHEPAAGDCLQCHHHHASDHPAMLLQPPLELCRSCHEDVADGALLAKHPHTIVTTGRACLNCHEPHAGRVEHLLLSEPIPLCLECHDRDIHRADGSVVTSLGGLADPTLTRHAPVQEGACRECHDPHGGPFDFLLTRAFPGAFYQRWDPQAYALCIECHDQAAFSTPRTSTLTGFRNGSRNLHYLHVAGGPEGGRSCRVCHSAHASAAGKLMRPDVPFGEWKIPIRFRATETGGSCAAGCHRARRYDRVTPVAEQ